MKTSRVLLIHPPVVRPCEPPLGIARLRGALKRHGVESTVIDANLEGLLFLCQRRPAAADTWTRRAFARVERNISALMHPATYRNPERYKQIVLELNRVLAMQDSAGACEVSLANFRDRDLSPVDSGDLIQAFETPERNPFYPYFADRLRQVMEKDPPRVVGLSLNFLSQALCSFAIMGVVRRLNPSVAIVAGGGLVTSWMRRPGWVNPFEGIVDNLVAGEGEAALLSLLGLECCGGSNLPDFDGGLPLRYFSPGFILPFNASRGCYWRRCAFCPEQAEANPYRPVAADRVPMQLDSLTRTLKPSLIHFTDNALSPALLKAMARASCDIPWYGFVRITRHLADAAFCAALKQAGCVMLQIGLESGSQKVLDGFGKGIDLETARKVLKNLKRAGIAAYVYLLFGTPWETESDAEKTLEFTARNSDAISFLNLAIFNLPAFGPYPETLNTRPLDTGDLFLYRSFVHPEGWDRRAIRRFLDSRFRSHPAIAPIIRNDPPVFTSSHAPFFCGAAGVK